MLALYQVSQIAVMTGWEWRAFSGRSASRFGVTSKRRVPHTHPADHALTWPSLEIQLDRFRSVWPSVLSTPLSLGQGRLSCRAVAVRMQNCIFGATTSRSTYLARQRQHPSYQDKAWQGLDRLVSDGLSQNGHTGRHRQKLHDLGHSDA